MPRKPPKPCSTPGCPSLVLGGGSKCTECQARRHRTWDANRGSSSERGYGARWQRIRADYLRRFRACVVCGQPATVADHVTLRKTLIARGVRNPDADRFLQALCKPHHDAKTAREAAFGRSPAQ